MTTSMMNARETSRRWLKPELIMITLPILGGVAAGIWQGGRIQQILLDTISTETLARQADTHAAKERMDQFQRQLQDLQKREADAREAESRAAEQRALALQQTVNDVRQDVRELRSYMMTKAQFGR